MSHRSASMVLRSIRADFRERERQRAGGTDRSGLKLMGTVGPKTSLKNIYVKDTLDERPNDVWKLQVNQKLIINMMYYVGQEIQAIVPERILSNEPIFFKLQPSNYNDLNNMREFIEVDLVKNLRLGCSESDIADFANEFRRHVMMHNSGKKHASILVVDFVTKAGQKIRKEERMCKVSTIKFRAGSSEEGASSSCAVCLVDFVDGSKVSRSPCKHLFHDSCLRTWLDKNSKNGCPMCRAPI